MRLAAVLPSKQAVDECRMRQGAGQHCRLIAFSAEAREVEQIPEPESHTDLVGGLRAAQGFDPGTTLFISDGQPDNAAAALAVARTFRGVIDVLYIGPDSDHQAISFMRQLAAAAGGQVKINDIGTSAGVQRLLGCIVGMLPGPSA